MLGHKLAVLMAAQEEGGIVGRSVSEALKREHAFNVKSLSITEGNVPGPQEIAQIRVKIAALERAMETGELNPHAIQAIQNDAGQRAIEVLSAKRKLEDAMRDGLPGPDEAPNEKYQAQLRETVAKNSAALFALKKFLAEKQGPK